METGHFIYSSCTPHSWVDFYLPLDEGLIGHNILFEVIMESEMQSSPEALAVYLYEDTTPRTAQAPSSSPSTLRMECFPLQSLPLPRLQRLPLRTTFSPCAAETNQSSSG